MKLTPLLWLRGLAFASALAILWPEDASANGHWRRRLGGIRASETILVEPTTYIVPTSAAYCCGDSGGPIAISEPPYRQTGYYVVNQGYGYALPTRYVVTSMSSFDMPAASGSASICCDPCAESSTTTTAPAPSNRGSAVDPIPAAETSASQPRKTVTSQPRDSSAPPTTGSAPRRGNDAGTGASRDPGTASRPTPPPPDVDSDPDREAVPAPADADSNSNNAASRRSQDGAQSPEADSKNDRGLGDILPPLPSSDPKKEQDPAAASSSSNADAPKGESVADAPAAKTGAPTTKTETPAATSSATPKSTANTPAPVDANTKRASGEEPGTSRPEIRSVPKAETEANRKREIISQPANDAGASPPSTESIVEQAADELLRTQSRKPVASGPVIAETVVQGTVIDGSSRDPLPSVKVILTDIDRKQSNLVAITDALGRYAVRVPTGRWRLTVSSLDSKPTFYADLDVVDGVVQNIANGRRYSTITLKR